MSPYVAGYDCGRNGPNANNCHFSLFSTTESTREWERGKADAEREHPRTLQRANAVKDQPANDRPEERQKQP